MSISFLEPVLGCGSSINVTKITIEIVCGNLLFTPMIYLRYLDERSNLFMIKIHIGLYYDFLA